MKRITSLWSFIAVVLLLGPALAQDAHQTSIHIGDPWARATAEGAPVGAAYFILTNSGTASDRLVAVSSPVAERVELHTHLMEDGIMKMRPVEAIEVAPGTPTVLQPGGLHIMLIGLGSALKAGGQFPLTLTFENAGAMAIEVPVRDVRRMQHQHHKGS